MEIIDKLMRWLGYVPREQYLDVNKNFKSVFDELMATRKDRAILREGFDAAYEVNEKQADELDEANRIIFEVRQRAHGRAILAIIERGKK